MWPSYYTNVSTYMLSSIIIDLYTWGVHSLLYFAYMCVQDLSIGGVIYLAEKIIR